VTVRRHLSNANRNYEHTAVKIHRLTELSCNDDGSNNNANDDDGEYNNGCRYRIRPTDEAIFSALTIPCRLLLQMKELRHDNVNDFIGACIDPPYFVLLTEYCAKGSLQATY